MKEYMTNPTKQQDVRLSVLFVLLLVLAVGCRPVDTVVSPTNMPATATPAPAATSTVVPTPTPVVWWQPEMKKVNDPVTGVEYWMAPGRVVQEVVKGFQGVLEVTGPFQDAQTYKSECARFTTDQILQDALVRAELDYKLAYSEKGVNRSYEVKSFAQDGLECTLGVRQTGGVIYITDTGTGVVQESRYDFLGIYRMRYDLQDERWKQAELLEMIPLERQQ